MHQIRPARLDDIPALITLMAEFYGESNYPLPEANARAAFATLLADPQLGGAWIAWVDEEPVGAELEGAGLVEPLEAKAVVGELKARGQLRGES